ncbi:UDP-glucuronosyltransferase 2C1-like [Amphiura filiformis]|uniref:UDP-glucuronosyltransferase 2C1-like n=1 Tax=Amphiura filiformis TaxID=82378 RepID=UPI003B21F98D
MANVLAVTVFVLLLVFQLLTYTPIVESVESADQTSDGANEELPQLGKSPSKILIPMFTWPGGSHDQQLATIGSGVADKGHVLHLLANTLPRDDKLIASFKASDVIYYKSPFTAEDVLKEEAKIQEASKSGVGPGMILRSQKLASDDCRSLFTDTATLARLKNEAYDLMISDIFFPCDVLLAHYLNIPFIGVTTTHEYPVFRKSLYGYPAELSYVPESFFGATDKMTFMQRVQNVFQHFLFSHVLPPILLRDFVQIQKDFDINPDSYLTCMMGKAVLWLSYSDLSLDYPHPSMPNYVPVGGMALSAAKALDTELEEFVQGSDNHGVIVFSLGSKIDTLGDTQMTEIFAKAFSRLPQRVIWRHDGDQPTNLGNNTKIMKWISQNDLLAHSKTRLFIGHGGTNGVYEALYHEVPMILIPLIAPDQWDNAARVVSKGMGLQLDSKMITEENLFEAISEVLSNKRYQEKVSHYSAILRDLPPAKEQAIFWIEHVLKFGGEHLRAHVFELNFIQYYLIDVGLFLILLVAVFICILRYIFVLCCSICKRGLKRNDVSQRSKTD